MVKVLFITSSSSETSKSTKLGERLVARFKDAKVTHRDLGKNAPPAVDQAWLTANFSPADKRTEEQKAKLALADTYIAELRDADVIVLSVAVYNFNIPASLKAWIDQMARVGETFKYTAAGPEGLLPKKTVYVVAASGGTPFGSPMDFYSAYLKAMFKFVGLETVLVASITGAFNAEESLKAAHAAIDAVAIE